MNRLLNIFLLIALFSTISCEKYDPNYEEKVANADFLHRSVDRVTEIIIHDIFSPPVASRIYAYPSIAAYEVMAQQDANYQTLAGQLTDFKGVPTPDNPEEICYPLAALTAFLDVGQALIFSEDSMKVFRAELQAEINAIGIPKVVKKASQAYGEAVAQAVLSWSADDNYKQTRTFPQYSITEDPAHWQPTPPGYMNGIEPSWNKIRPFVIDSAQQFVPAPPTAFSLDKESKFYEEVLEVYTALDEEREERIAIAEFWDCNPYVSHTKGHFMFATKKITPGGHWMGIASIAARKTNADFVKTTATYALTSIALADGFISCWDEKYRSRLLRPETYINNYLDEDWQPALQTPPFPEYTSGHSVISRSAAVALTSLYGNNFAFDDDTEVAYGLPVRSFTSFFHASDEAAVSRLYGGIHYAPACFNGVDQGEQVGRFVVSNLLLQPEQLSQQ